MVNGLNSMTNKKTTVLTWFGLDRFWWVPETRDTPLY